MIVSMYFFFYNRVLLIPTNFFTLFRLYPPYNSTGRVRLRCDDQNVPERRIRRCLGHSSLVRTSFSIGVCVAEQLFNLWLVVPSAHICYPILCWY
jgi:hypothetical protein